MEKYEFMFILRVDMSDPDRDNALLKLKQEIEKSKGEILKEESWGKKRLAYKINGQSEGYYFIWNIALPKDVTSTFKKKLELSSEVLRGQILKQSEV